MQLVNPLRVFGCSGYIEDFEILATCISVRSSPWQQLLTSGRMTVTVVGFTKLDAQCFVV